ncbi:unnamed protein product, partial [Discosporangium mesarthrocarpum]
MWVPTLQGAVPGGGSLPTGLIFSSFMVCITIGGVLFSLALRVTSVERASVTVFLVAAASMVVAAVATMAAAMAQEQGECLAGGSSGSGTCEGGALWGEPFGSLRDWAVATVARGKFAVLLSSFLVLETCVGAFYSCSGMLRSRYIPGEVQSSVMNVFRLPLNVLVVVGTRVTELVPAALVFGIVALWFASGAALQMCLCVEAAMGSSNREQGVCVEGLRSGPGPGLSPGPELGPQKGESGALSGRSGG